MTPQPAMTQDRYAEKARELRTEMARDDVRCIPDPCGPPSTDCHCTKQIEAALRQAHVAGMEQAAEIAEASPTTAGGNIAVHIRSAATPILKGKDDDPS